MHEIIKNQLRKGEKQIEHERACRKLGFQGSILSRLSAEVTKSGYAGSTKVPELVYLAFFTSMLRRPVSLVIKGPSGAGKSFGLNTGKQFIPEEFYEQFEGMSEKALVYLEGLDLKHKHLVIGEAAGMADGDGRALLRQLLSEDKVKYATVQSTDKSGLSGETLPVLEGPCGLVVTTTAGTLHHEDETRMISVNLSESPDQIREALMAQAMGANKKVDPIETDPWHEFYRLVRNGPKEVKIPYAFHIGRRLPVSHDRIKRDFPQLLSLISAHALMHSFDREWVDDKKVVANEDDYANVYRLVNEAISEGLDKTASAEIKQLVEATAELTRHGPDSLGVSQTKLAEHIGRDQSAISRNVRKAVVAGYLENKNPGQGKVAKLTLGDRKLPNKQVLPEPKELFGSITEAEPANDNGTTLSAAEAKPW